MTTPAGIIAEFIASGIHGDVMRPIYRADADTLIAALDAAGFDIVARQPDTHEGRKSAPASAPGAHEMAQTLAAWHDRGQR